MENTEKKSKTMTTREFLEAFIRGDYEYTVNDMTMVDKAHALLDAMNARNEAKKEKKDSSKPSKSFEENAPLREKVKEILAKNSGSMIAKDIAGEMDCTIQKTSSVIRQMVEAGMVERIDNGRNKPLEYKLIG